MIWRINSESDQWSQKLDSFRPQRHGSEQGLLKGKQGLHPGHLMCGDKAATGVSAPQCPAPTLGALGSEKAWVAGEGRVGRFESTVPLLSSDILKSESLDSFLSPAKDPNKHVETETPRKAQDA